MILPNSTASFAWLVPSPEPCREDIPCMFFRVCIATHYVAIDNPFHLETWEISQLPFVYIYLLPCRQFAALFAVLWRGGKDSVLVCGLHSGNTSCTMKCVGCALQGNAGLLGSVHVRYILTPECLLKKWEWLHHGSILCVTLHHCIIFFTFIFCTVALLPLEGSASCIICLYPIVRLSLASY